MSSKLYIQVPAPIQLKDVRTGEPSKMQKMIAGEVKVVDHEAESLFTFTLERLNSEKSTFKDQRIWSRILNALEKAEAERAVVFPELPIIEIIEEDLTFFKAKMEALQLAGYILLQFMAFTNALEDAKREKPQKMVPALRSVEESKPASA